jgi:hypothetical protein
MCTCANKSTSSCFWVLIISEKNIRFRFDYFRRQPKKGFYVKHNITEDDPAFRFVEAARLINQICCLIYFLELLRTFHHQTMILAAIQYNSQTRYHSIAYR